MYGTNMDTLEPREHMPKAVTGSARTRYRLLLALYLVLVILSLIRNV